MVDGLDGELVRRATECSKAKILSEEATSGLAGAALLAANGEIYVAKSLSGSCGISFCGEVGAVLAMLSDGVSEVLRIAVVSNDRKLMPACGRCCELLYQIDRKNLNTVFLLEEGKQLSLGEMHPIRWQELWEDR